MPKILKLAASQSRTLATTAETLRALAATTQKAASAGAHLILFPEAYLGGYPRTCTFGASVGARDPGGREQFLQYFLCAVDLGDTPTGAGDDWIDRKLPVAKGSKYRGDGTREELEIIARDTGVFIVTGLVERCAGSLYCAAVYVCPERGTLGKRRKVMPTGSERLIWAQGSPSTLRAVTTVINGVKLTLAAAICWENYMGLLRHSLYSQNVNLYLAPTADARDTWLPLMRTIGFEGRSFVLSANQCVKRKNLPPWIRSDASEDKTDMTQKSSGRRRSTVSRTEEGHEVCWPAVTADVVVEEPDTMTGLSKDAGKPREINGDEHGRDAISPCRRRSIVTRTPEQHDIAWPQSPSPMRGRLEKTSVAAATEQSDEDFVSRGGSCIISPQGEVLAGPLWEVEDGGLLVAEVDFEDCERGRLDLDVAGSYSRNDAFKLIVEGLDINPPP